MKKYQVLIARNETTVYTIEVKARSEDEAEKKAYKKWAENDYKNSKVVYGEEETHEINEVEYTEEVKLYDEGGNYMGMMGGHEVRR